jgi:hypothetical protein
MATSGLFALCILAQLRVALRAVLELHARWRVGPPAVFGGVVAEVWAAVDTPMGMEMTFITDMLSVAMFLVGLLWVMILPHVPLAAALSACARLGILGLFGMNPTIRFGGPSRRAS